MIVSGICGGSVRCPVAPLLNSTILEVHLLRFLIPTLLSQADRQAVPNVQSVHVLRSKDANFNAESLAKYLLRLSVLPFPAKDRTEVEHCIQCIRVLWPKETALNGKRLALQFLCLRIVSRLSPQPEIGNQAVRQTERFRVFVSQDPAIDAEGLAL